MNELEPVGRARSGREVLIGFFPAWSDVLRLDLQRGAFVLFVVEDLPASATRSPLSEAAHHLLDTGAVYVCAWGPRCRAIEDVFDWAAIDRDPDGRRPIIMTTSHAEESLEEAFDFAISFAQPADEYAESCRRVIGIFIGNVTRYHVIHEYCADALSGP